MSLPDLNLSETSKRGWTEARYGITSWPEFTSSHVYEVSRDLSCVVPSYSRATQSQVTADYFIRQPTCEVWVPKNPKLRALQPPRKPQKPKYKKPVWIEPTPPRMYRGKDKNRLSQSLLSQQRFIEKRAMMYERFERLMAKYELAMSCLDEVYEKRLQKYEKKLAFYNAIEARKKTFVFKRVRNARIPIQENPYRREEAWWIESSFHSMRRMSWYDASYPGLISEIRSYNLNHPTDFLAGWEPYVRAELTHILKRHENKLNRKIYQKLANSKVHVGNMVAERAQTIRLLQDTFKKLLKMLSSRNLLYKGVGDIREGTRDIANKTLEYNFGWKPLLQDIYDLVQILLNSGENDAIKDEFVVRTNYCEEVDCEIPIEPYVLSGYTVSFSKVHVKGTVNKSYVLKYTVSNEQLAILKGFGLINPAEIAWEMLPWSFVIDWFLPVGAWIQGLSADAGITFRTGTYSTRYKLLVTLEGRSESNAPWVPGVHRIITTGGSQLVWYYKDREVLTEPPSQQLPSLKNPLSVTHTVEGLALVIQRLLR